MEQRNEHFCIGLYEGNRRIGYIVRHFNRHRAVVYSRTSKLYSQCSVRQFSSQGEAVAWVRQEAA